MKVALISDIHSNFFYLQEVSRYLEKSKIDKILFLGDAVGYYDEPNLVVDWLRDRSVTCIKGNHDQYLLGELTYPGEREKFYRAQIHRSLISEKNLNFMKSWEASLELVIHEKKFLLIHSGSPDSEKYCRTIDDLDSNKVNKYDYFLFGHTHIPWVEYYKGSCLINPGSVGQPRDYVPMPSFVVLDLEQESVKVVRTKVDFSSYQKILKTNNYDEFVINILSRKNA